MCLLRLPLPTTAGILLATLTWLMMMGIGLFLSGCPLDTISTRRSIDAQASLASFEKHVYPLLQKMKCSSCHYEAGEAKSKPFADSNTTVAHNSALKVVAFGDIENSALITRQRDGHQCDKNSGECDDNIEKLVEALTEWEKSRAGKQSSYLLTAAKDADGNTSTLEFSLEGLLTNPQGTVTLAVTVVKENSTRLLTLRNFKLTNPSDPIFIGGLKARRNGIDSAMQSLDRVCALIDKGADNKALPQYSEIVFSLSDGDEHPNKISIGLKDLRIATSEDKCAGEDIVADGNGMAASSYENEFNNKASGIGKIIHDGCTKSCHNPAVNENGTDLSTFAKFSAARDKIITRVACEEINPDLCMPKIDTDTSWRHKFTLLEWLTKLPQ